ncbi:DUF7283 family protein [Halomarina oriensis]|uniref:Uncharacterized protein n=1 Tax=Halomarina oriensis TaxID=671145 RepID=A0A6B0GPR4_9EURY|nr:hypothetical protein [Halomarina oriensis]MWG35427.1 hypothetical protein [Halomarina oriensis]
MPTDAPTDLLPVWTGLTVASLALFGVVVGLPTGAPDATEPASTVDEVASSSYDASATVSFRTRSRVELRPHGLDRCRGDACAHATFEFGPVVPVAADSSLAAVVAGVAPESVFDSPATLRRAVERARQRAPVVTTTSELHARHISWGEVDVTLVGT